MYVCICMYLCVYVCLSVSLYVRMCVCAHVHMCVHTCACVSVCVCVHACVRVCVWFPCLLLDSCKSQLFERVDSIPNLEAKDAFPGGTGHLNTIFSTFLHI